MCQINLITTALSEALLHSLWQGLLISVLLGLVLKLLSGASAHKRYLAATSALLLHCMLFGASFYYAAQQAAPTATPTLEIDQISNFGLSNEQYATETNYFNLVSSSINSVLVFSRENHLVISAIWLLGIMLLSFRFAGGLLLVEKLKKSDHRVPNSWKRRMNRLATSMGVHQKVRLVFSSKVTVPSITGWLKPVIIIPLSVINNLPPDEVESILAHELAHIKRHDYLVSILQAMVEIMMFFNPFVWWISNLINEERELCCDDMAIKAVGNHQAYIYALANLTMHATTNKVPVGQGVLAATGKKNSVIFRINRIMKKVNKKQHRPHFSIKNLTGGLIAYMFVLALVSFTFIGSGNAQEKQNSISKSSFITEGDSTTKQIIIYETTGNNSVKLDGTTKSKFVFKTKDGRVLTTDEKKLDDKSFESIEKIQVIKLDDEENPVILEEKVFGGHEEGKETSEKIEFEKGAFTIIESDKNILLDSSKVSLVEVGVMEDGTKNIVIRGDSTKKVKSNFIVKSTKNEKPDPIYIIDGEKVEHGKLKEIDPNQIEKINVFKGEKAIEKYGPEGENGVIVIELKNGNVKENNEQKTELKGNNEVYYVLDGEAITKADFENIDPNSIKSINVLKDKFATKKYGDLAKGGAVEIFLKKILTETPPPPPALPKIEDVNKAKVVTDAFISGIAIFPNPSSDVFNINFKLEADAQVKVSVHDLNGKEVSLLANESMSAGVHQLNWNAKGMTKGLYLVNILKDEVLYQQKIILD